MPREVSLPSDPRQGQKVSADELDQASTEISETVSLTIPEGTTAVCRAVSLTPRTVMGLGPVESE